MSSPKNYDNCIEGLPSVSMSSRSNYVTQSSVYDNPRLSKLTNRRIAKYEEDGKYGLTLPQDRKDKHKKQKRTKPTARVNQLLQLLNSL